MTDALTLELHNRQQAYAIINAQLLPWLAGVLQADARYVLTVKRRKRTPPQNSKMWAMLSEVSDQVNWHGRKLTPGEWKDVFTSALKKMDVVPGIDGGFVVLGGHTSKMTTKELANLIELIQAFGVEYEVKFKGFYESDI